MFRLFLLATPLLIASVSIPSEPAAAAAREDRPGKSCKPKKKGGLFRSVAGAIANAGASAVGVPSGVAGVYIPVGSLLSDAIISRLNCKEQVQAATATNEAVRGGVGTTASWESETRPDVSGSSTVVAQNRRSDGGSCMTVNDVIIVGGEETTVPKTMCRAPGASGYTLAA
jgi:hypothetical protein